MIAFQNLHIDGKMYILLNFIKSVRPKCVFRWMFQQIPMGLYCLHVSAAAGSVMFGEQ